MVLAFVMAYGTDAEAACLATFLTARVDASFGLVFGVHVFDYGVCCVTHGKAFLLEGVSDAKLYLTGVQLDDFADVTVTVRCRERLTEFFKGSSSVVCKRGIYCDHTFT